MARWSLGTGGPLTDEVSWDSQHGKNRMSFWGPNFRTPGLWVFPSPGLCPPFQAHERPSHPVFTTSYTSVHRSWGPRAHLLAHPRLDHFRVEELVQLTPSLETTTPRGGWRRPVRPGFIRVPAPLPHSPDSPATATSSHQAGPAVVWPINRRVRFLVAQ